MSQPRVVVVGGGAMGAATAWALAREGHPVTLLEQFAADHTHGSSHGSSRIFRFSYEDPHYVELGVQAQGLWRTLEEESARDLVAVVGCVTHGPHEVVAPVHAALVARGVRCDLVSQAEAGERWPVLRLDDTVLVEHEAGRADAGAAVAALHAEAARLGGGRTDRVPGAGGPGRRARRRGRHRRRHDPGRDGRPVGRGLAARPPARPGPARGRTFAAVVACPAGHPGAAGLLPSRRLGRRARRPAVLRAPARLLRRHGEAGDRLLRTVHPGSWGEGGRARHRSRGPIRTIASTWSTTVCGGSSATSRTGSPA